MSGKLKILLLEDLESDADLVCRVIKKARIEFEILVVDSKDHFIKALNEFSPDLILSDHTLPSFSSREALKILATKSVKIPFILVTGTMSEEFAVSVMKEGAWDYVPKNNLQQLPDAINKAMDKFKYEKLRQKFLYEAILNEAYMEEAERIAHYGSWEVDMINKKFKLSKEAYNILGFETGETEFFYDNLLSSVHPDEVLHLEQLIKHVLTVQDFTVYKDAFRLVDKNGLARFIKTEFVLKYNFQQHLLRINGFIQDITDLIMLEERLLESEEKFRSLAISVNKAATYSNVCETISSADAGTQHVVENAERAILNEPLLLTYVNPEIQYSELPRQLRRRGNWQTNNEPS